MILICYYGLKSNLFEQNDQILFVIFVKIKQVVLISWIKLQNF